MPYKPWMKRKGWHCETTLRVLNSLNQPSKIGSTAARMYKIVVIIPWFNFQQC